MTLSSSSNTINALGIFGRLEIEQEKSFLKLSQKFSRYPKNDDAIGIFNHLSLVINHNVAVGDLAKYIDLLRDLKAHLPLKIKTFGVIIKEEKHLALSFDTRQTQEIRRLAQKYFEKGVVKTHYTKIVWFVPKEKQEKVIKELSKVKEMVFDDFKLCANRQDDQSTIYSSLKYK